MIPHLDVDVTTCSGRTVVTLTGALDMDTVPYVTETTNAIDLTGQTIVMDFAGVTFMDSSAINLLCALRRRALAAGSALQVRGLREQGLRVLDLTGTKDLFLPPSPAADPSSPR
ncbi:STAS domain-containing protein [Streptomyces sp. NPDC059917]|uniref:STAS domain-containing protein n=1 Tax=Streptomyces sp. NPDC059917 TaxID=3347002 RepID=UPI003648E92D